MAYVMKVSNLMQKCFGVTDSARQATFERKLSSVSQKLKIK